MAHIPQLNEDKDSLPVLKQWLIQVDKSEDPENYFEFMNREGVGRSQALFYEVWARYCENKGKHAKADEVFKLGVSRKAKPLDRLQKHYDEFLARMAEKKRPERRAFKEALLKLNGSESCFEEARAEWMEKTRERRHREEKEKQEREEKERKARQQREAEEQRLQRLREEEQRLHRLREEEQQQRKRRDEEERRQREEHEASQRRHQEEQEEQRRQQQLKRKREEDELRAVAEKENRVAKKQKLSYEEQRPLVAERALRERPVNAMAEDDEIDDDDDVDTATVPAATSEPTMTIHTRTAWHDVMAMFSTPLPTAAAAKPSEPAARRPATPPPASTAARNGLVRGKLTNADVVKQTLGSVPSWGGPHDDSDAAMLDAGDIAFTAPAEPHGPGRAMGFTIYEDPELADSDPATAGRGVAAASPIVAHTAGDDDNAENADPNTLQRGYAACTPLTKPQSQSLTTSFVLSPMSSASSTPCAGLSLSTPASPGDAASPSKVRQQCLRSLTPPLTADPRYVDMADMAFAGTFELNSDITLHGRKRSDVSFDLFLEGLVASTSTTQVYRAQHVTDITTSDMDNTLVCVKVRQPPDLWEFYISSQLQRRVKDPVARAYFASFRACYVYRDRSVGVLDYWDQGSLAAVVQAYKAHKMRFEETLAIYYTIELLKIIEQLHTAGIVHGNVCAENLLVRDGNTPEWGQWKPSGAVGWDKRGLQLAGFSQSIDMTVGYAPAGRARYEALLTDLFGVCGVVHALLFGEQLELARDAESGKFCTTSTFEKTRMAVQLWQPLYDELLNFASDDTVALLQKQRQRLENFLVSNPSRAESIRSLLRRQSIMMNECI